MTGTARRLEDFAPRLGQEFVIGGGSSRAFPALLVAATALRPPIAGQPMSSFQLQFRCAEHTPASFRPQQIYVVSHPELGLMEMFLVPVGPPRDGSGGMLYQAIFH